MCIKPAFFFLVLLFFVLRPCHLHLSRPSLPRQLVGDLVQQGVRSANIGAGGVELGQERGGLCALGLYLVKEGGVVRLHRLQPGVELVLLRGQERGQVRGQDLFWREEMRWSALCWEAWLSATCVCVTGAVGRYMERWCDTTGVDSLHAGLGVAGVLSPHRRLADQSFQLV